MSVQLSVVKVSDSEGESSDYDFSDIEEPYSEEEEFGETETETEESEDSEEDEFGEFEEELLGLSLEERKPQVSWRTPVTGVALEIIKPEERATEIVFEIQPSPLPPAQLSPTQPSPLPPSQPSPLPPAQPFILPQLQPAIEIAPEVSNIEFSVVGRDFILRDPSGLLNPYIQYLANLRGKYKPDLIGGAGWVFLKRQEKEVRNLVGQIMSGALPPPSELPLPPTQPSIDMAAVAPLPPRPTLTPQVQILETSQLPIEIVPPARKTRAKATVKPVLQTTVPSALPGSMQPTLTPPLQPVVLGVPTVAGQMIAPLPAYDPTQKTPGESQVEYDRRVQLYNMLVTQGLPSSSADVLARMRNNVDIHGISYDDEAMRTLNTYLPLQ